jgi:hypothetical protein
MKCPVPIPAKVEEYRNGGEISSRTILTQWFTKQILILVDISRFLHETFIPIFFHSATHFNSTTSVLLIFIQMLIQFITIIKAKTSTVPNWHITKAYRGIKLKLMASLNSVPGQGEWPSSQPGRLSLAKDFLVLCEYQPFNTTEQVSTSYRNENCILCRVESQLPNLHITLNKQAHHLLSLRFYHYCPFTYTHLLSSCFCVFK